MELGYDSSKANQKQHMLGILFSIIPIFVLIVLGYILKRNGIPSLEFWSLNDRLVYWVLFPALLFYQTSTSDIEPGFAGLFLGAIVGAFLLTSISAFLLSRGLHFAAPVVTSVMQGSARHNTFIALAIAQALFGAEGVALAALATAVLVPPTNVIMVGSMVMLHPNDSKRALLPSLLRELSRNPLIVSVAAGLTVNALYGEYIPVLHDTTALLGKAALPIVLLAIGAHLTFDRFRAAISPILVAALGKVILFPVFAVFLATQLGITSIALMIVALYACVPTASSAFTLSRQMGGDAKLMASIITLQTLLSLITVPITLSLVGYFFQGH